MNGIGVKGGVFVEFGTSVWKFWLVYVEDAIRRYKGDVLIVGIYGSDMEVVGILFYDWSYRISTGKLSLVNWRFVKQVCREEQGTICGERSMVRWSKCDRWDCARAKNILDVSW